ncbi:MAG: DNA-3-methyladenine glycosylase I [Candidatus Velthaea sp.]
MEPHTGRFAHGRADLARCAWATTDLSIPYHDDEWGVPVHADRTFFEFLILEGAQAGLSWETILRKRARYREVFDEFDPAKVARYGAAKVGALLADAGIIRNRAKIASAITNANAFLAVQREFGSFDAYVWRFVGGKPIVTRRRVLAEVPVTTPEAEVLSNDLRARGFGFVGPTIVYAFMQATGLVDDHLASCPSRSGVRPGQRPPARAPHSR